MTRTSEEIAKQFLEDTLKMQGSIPEKVYCAVGALETLTDQFKDVRLCLDPFGYRPEHIRVALFAGDRINGRQEGFFKIGGSGAEIATYFQHLSTRSGLQLERAPIPIEFKGITACILETSQLKYAPIVLYIIPVEERYDKRPS
ncbi:MAG: hypothetical protein AABX70_02155 [Nanoarchaeota archaeon]